MTQFSLPQAGLFPADGDDCGAYTANEWAAVLISQNRAGGMLVTGAASPPGLPGTQTDANIGVYYQTANRLAVTSPGASQISIDTGAALVDGRHFVNDTAISAVAITNPAANPRIDRVVVRQNYTALDYTSVNAPALVVDFNTARIAIISGAENVAPVAPSLTQDEDRATYWDIPLAQYEIAVAGTITNLTDEREWVDAETKETIMQWQGAYNAGGVSIIDYYNVMSGLPGFVLNATQTNQVAGIWQVPQDFISDLVVNPLYYNSSNIGNIVASLDTYTADCGEAYNTHTSTTGNQTVAIAAPTSSWQCPSLLDLTVANAAVGDFVIIEFTRLGGDGSDTADYIVTFGAAITYLGWGRG